MGKFDQNSNYNKEANFTQVKIGEQMPLLEVELNEMQQIQEEAKKDAIRDIVHSGFIRSGDMAFNAGVVTFTGDNIVYLDGMRIVIPTGLQFNIPYSTPTKDVLVFIEAWYEEVTSTSAIKKYGGADQANIANTMLDSRIGFETSHRVQLKWRLRAQDNLDFAAGFNFNDMIYPIAGNTPPTVIGQAAYKYISLANTANKFGKIDKNLYMSGDVTNIPNSKTLMKSVDGMAYMIPVMAIRYSSGSAVTDLRPLTGLSGKIEFDSHASTLATTAVAGHVKAGDGIAVNAGVISVDVGQGMQLLGTSPNKTLSPVFTTSGGDNGSANTVARGDHTHDTRYYTETELGSTTPGSSGASKIAAPAGNSFGAANMEAFMSAVKSYIDLAIQGLASKQPVRVASIANISLTGLQTIDGVTLVAGDRVLVKDQTVATQNGIWVAATGTWTRPTDFDTPAKVLSALVLVTEGTVNKDCSFLMTTDAPITLGTTALNWVQFSGAGQLIAGQGITKSGNTLSISDSAITDALIGARTMTDTNTPNSGTGQLNVLLSALASMIKKITGGANYYTTPPTTLTDAKNHIDAGSPHNNHARSLSFIGDIRGATWSRILNMTGGTIMGHSFLLHVSHTRGSVVYSATFLVTASHSQKANIVQLANTTYSNFKIRAVIKTSGDGYIEIYDDANSATASTIITPYVHVVNLNSIYLSGTLSGITTFTDGTTLDADMAVGHEITTVSGNKIIADLVGSASKLGGQDPAYYLEFANMTGKPTTLSGYGITDAAPGGFGLGGIAKRLATGYDLNTLLANGWYDVNNPINGVAELGTGWHNIFIMCSGDNKYVTQFAFDMTQTAGNMMWIRKSHSSGTVWTPWERILNKTYSDTLYAPRGFGLGEMATTITGNLNDFVTTGFYRGSNLTSAPPYKAGVHNSDRWWYILVMGHGNSNSYTTQTAIEYNTGETYTRVRVSGTWTAWKRSISRNDIGDMGVASALNSTDLNTVYSSGFYMVRPTCTNLPDEGFGNSFLMVTGDAVNSCTQIINSYGEGDVARTAYRSAVAGSWSPWKIIGSENYSLVNADGSIKSPGTTDFNSMTNTGFYALSGSGYTNGPTSSAYGALQVMVSGLAVTQIYYRNINEIYTRMRDDGGTWSEWKQSVTYGLIKNDGSGLAADDIDMNNYTKSGFYFVQFSNPTNGPGGGMYGILHVMSENTSSSSNVKQMFYPRNGYPIYRTKQVSSWSAWDTVMTQSLSDAYYFPKTTPLPLISGGNSAGMHYRDVANYNSNTSAITGVLKIKLPKSWSNTMLDLVIKGHTHGGIGSGAWELRLGGYNYTSGPAWQQVSAVLNREAPFTQVRFAHDGTTCCILLGTLTTVWAYPKLIISEVLAAFSNQTGWDTGYTISIITSETGITTTATLDASMFNQSYALTNPNGNAKMPGTTDLNAITGPGNWTMNGTGYTNGISPSMYGTLQVVQRSSTSLSQIFYADGGEIYTRSLTGTTWSAWSTLQRFPLTNADGTGKAPGTSNFDLMLTPGQYTIDGACDNNPRQGTNARGILDIKKLSTGRIIQEFTYDQDYIGSTGGCKYIRSYSGSAWSSWVESIDGNSTMQKYPLTNYNGLPLPSLPSGSDLNNYADTGNYGLSGSSYTNAPAVTMYGILEVQRRLMAGASESTIQRITLTDSGRVYTRTKHGNSWTSWRKIMNDVDDFTRSIQSGSGWEKLPSGKIRQWGTISLTQTSLAAVATQNVNFPIAFPTECSNIQVTPMNSAPLQVDASANYPSKSYFSIYLKRSDVVLATTIHWEAIGY